MDREEYDYINRDYISLPLFGLQGYVDTLPSRCYASPRLDLGCFVGNFLIFMQRSPSVASELGLCVDVYARVEHKEVVGVDVQIAYLLCYFGFGGIVG